MARALRPLRLANFVEGIRIVVSSLFKAMAGILNSGMVVLLFFGMLGIVGMNLFQGQYYNCVWAGSAVQPYGDVGLSGLEQVDSRVVPSVIIDPASKVIVDKGWCTQGTHTITWPEGIPPYQLQTTWVQTYLRNFDHLGFALLALFELATTSLWLDVMFYGADTVDMNLNPVTAYDRSKARGSPISVRPGVESCLARGGARSIHFLNTHLPHLPPSLRRKCSSWCA